MDNFSGGSCSGWVSDYQVAAEKKKKDTTEIVEETIKFDTDTYNKLMTTYKEIMVSLIESVDTLYSMKQDKELNDIKVHITAADKIFKGWSIAHFQDLLVKSGQQS